MNFLKQNWYKLGISLGVVVAGISIGYYFLYYIPEKDKAEALDLKQRECSKQAQNKYENDKKDAGQYVVILPPRFKYNERLDSCFYLYGSLSTISKYTTQQIIDLKTYEVISSYTMSSEIPLDDVTSARIVEFNKTEREIFN